MRPSFPTPAAVSILLRELDVARRLFPRMSLLLKRRPAAARSPRRAQLPLATRIDFRNWPALTLAFPDGKRVTLPWCRGGGF